MKKFHTEILGEVCAKDKMEVARQIKGFCLTVSEQPLEQIVEQQIIDEVI